MIFNYNKNFYQLINNNMLSTHQTIQPFFVFVAISLVKLKPSIYPGIPPLRFLTNGQAYSSMAVLFIYKLHFY